MPYAEIAIAIVFAVAFAKGGEMEARGGRADHGLLWVALSLALSALLIAVVGVSLMWLILAQLALFVAIGAVRAHLAARSD